MAMRMGMGKCIRAALTGIALFGSGLAANTFFPSQAQAQWIGYRHHYYAPPVVEPDDEMSPRELIYAVRSQGFNQPSRPVYHDEVAVVTAIDPQGRRVRLTLDAYSGSIINLTPLGRVQVARPRPERPQVMRPRAEPPEERPRVVQRVPDQGATIRRSVPDQDVKTRATPERPTVIRREPLLPPQPGSAARPAPDDKSAPGSRVAPAQPSQAQKVAPPVGSGTREAPRRIELAPAPNTATPARPAPPAVSDPGSTPPI